MDSTGQLTFVGGVNDVGISGAKVTFCRLVHRDNGQRGRGPQDRFVGLALTVPCSQISEPNSNIIGRWMLLS